MTREENLSYLNNMYGSSSNELLAVYGSRFAGVRSFIREFLKGKENFYYKAIPCDLNVQMNLILSDLSLKVKYSAKSINDFSVLIKEYSKTGGFKKIIILDDFYYLIQENPTLINFLLSVIRDECAPGSIMIILSSENPDFMENDFLLSKNKIIYELNGVLYIKPLSPMEVLKKYKISFPEMISYYSVLGGNSYLWDAIDVHNLQPVKDFINNEIISPYGRLHDHGENLLPFELRETSVYNTILYALSGGNTKLNDLHEKTGYSRAKISVYLKNLNKYGITDKLQSIATDNEEGIKKGIYSVSDNFIKFYYRFIFGNLSKTLYMTQDKFYKKYVDAGLADLKEETYTLYCMEKLYADGFFSNEDSVCGKFYDKYNAVDFAIKTSENGLVLCATRFSLPHMSFDRLDAILSFCDKYKIKYESIYLISAVDFDQKLHLYSSMHNNVRLISLK